MHRLAASSSRLWFHPSCIERLYAVILKINLRNLIEVQDRFVCVAHLEILKHHPCDLPSRGKAVVFMCSFLLNEDPSLEVSVDDLLESTR